ncbi:MAG: ferredoxin [Gaiellaceae bacterium]|nr:MAG: ferredoxin [Gaiellaceae bacterium]
MTHHLTAEHVSADMRECIKLCSDCHDVCLETVAHCLDRGGEHARPDHVRALLDCAQACDTARDFMLRGSDLHAVVCRACADACERCADSCEAIGPDDDVMRNCAEICRRCAESCRSMASARAA